MEHSKAQAIPSPDACGGGRDTRTCSLLRAGPSPGTSLALELRDPGSGASHPLDPAARQYRVGCSADADIRITAPYVSSYHCSIEMKRNGRWYLRDAGSKNGTLINGARVTMAELRPGLQLRIGQSKLYVASPASHDASARTQLIGSSQLFTETVKRAMRAARSSCSILILGETGTGKELFARAIHEASARSDRPFVAVNCGAIPKELINSELFGHVKGAFTGASADHQGLFSQANRGTLFLDELGELPAEQQPHLLRALESRMIRRVGAPLEEMVDTRVLAATNRLQLEAPDSPIRSDLYHRLATVVIDLPPLRERREDIPVLIDHFLRAEIPEHGPHKLAKGCLDKLVRHCWSGNIRELKNAVSRAVTMGSAELRVRDFLPNGITETPPEPQRFVRQALEQSLSPYQRRQRELVAEAYSRAGSIRRAAEELGIAKSTFADLCRRLGIDTRRRARRF